jgi:hypothetical protein
MVLLHGVACHHEVTADDAACNATTFLLMMHSVTIMLENT